MGPLTDDHRCPRGRSRGLVARVVTPVAGAVVGMALCYGLVDRPHSAVVLASAALGALLATSLKQAVMPGA